LLESPSARKEKMPTLLPWTLWEVLRIWKPASLNFSGFGDADVLSNSTFYEVTA